MKYLNSSLIALALATAPVFAADPVAYQQNSNVQQGSAVMDVNLRSFQQALASASKPMILVFSASWCKPCQAMKPILDEIAKEMPNVTFMRADFDASPDLAQSYQIESIPAILFIRQDGMVVDRVIGYSAKQQLQGRIQQFAGSMK